MGRKRYFLLYLAALIVLLVVAAFEHAPGYMDSDYYQLTGQQLAKGLGFIEPVLWNYLDNPQGLPHPSHSYWMPLPSLIVAACLRIFGSQDFEIGRIGFIFLGAAIAPLTAGLAQALGAKMPGALLAGGLAVFPVFYLPYLPTTDSFGISMLLGGIFFLLLVNAEKRKLGNWQALCLGFVGGLIHSARAEGFLWLLIALWAGWSLAENKSALWMVLGGYFLVMTPWLLRNWLTFGTLLSPGASRTLWLTNYNELFSFPASQLSFAHWLASGWGAIFRVRLAALGQNLATTLSVESFIFLLPVIIWALWKLRRIFSVQAAAVAWIGLTVFFSFALPFSGTRGGFFHAAATLQPMLWALAALGLEAFIEWGTSRRGWEPLRYFHLFAVAATVFVLGLSVYVFWARVIGNNFTAPIWDRSAKVYMELGQRLNEMGTDPRAIVMVNNPPGFALATAYPAIVIPDGGIETSLVVARRYSATVFILENNHPAGLDELYKNPKLRSDLIYITSLDGAQIFFIP